ncbi:PPE domain-containing protein [Gandjariella thermophila]|nr:hypothetical protein [Gandjariella thermophila]
MSDAAVRGVLDAEGDGLRGGVARMDPPALTETYHWQGFRHRQLYDMVHTDNDPGRAGEFGETSRQIGQVIGAHQQRLTSALAKAGVWQGAAADQATAALQPLANWSQTAAATSGFYANRVALQANAAQQARDAMPEPVDFDPKQVFLQSLHNDPFNVFKAGTDVYVKYKQQQQAEEQARQVMSTLESSSRSVDTSTPQWTVPPDATAGGPAQPGQQPPPGSPPPPGGQPPPGPGGWTPHQWGTIDGPGAGGGGTTTGPNPGGRTWTPPGPTTGTSVAAAGPPPGSWAPPVTSPSPTPGPEPIGQPPAGFGPWSPVSPVGGEEFGSGGRGTGTGFGPGGRGTGTGFGPNGRESGTSFGPRGSAGGVEARPGTQGPGSRTGVGSGALAAEEAAASRGAAGARGAAGGPGAMGGTGAGRGKGGEDKEHRRPAYLLETDDVFGDGRRVAPPVIGEEFE